MTLADQLEAASEAVDGRGEVEIDASLVTFLDSFGLRFLLRLARGGGVVVARPSESVRTVLQLTGADAVIRTVDA